MIHLLSALQQPAEENGGKKRKTLLGVHLVNQRPQTGLCYLLLTARPDASRTLPPLMWRGFERPGKTDSCKMSCKMSFLLWWSTAIQGTRARQLRCSASTTLELLYHCSPHPDFTSDVICQRMCVNSNKPNNTVRTLLSSIYPLCCGVKHLGATRRMHHGSDKDKV